MAPVWALFIDSGEMERILGIKAKLQVIPPPGERDPNSITKNQRYCKHQVIYSSKVRYVQHKSVINLDHEVTLAMTDRSAPPLFRNDPAPRILRSRDRGGRQDYSWSFCQDGVSCPRPLGRGHPHGIQQRSNVNPLKDCTLPIRMVVLALGRKRIHPRSHIESPQQL